MSNLKQIGLAIVMYVNDYDGWLPIRWNGSVPWHYVLKRGNYLGNVATPGDASKKCVAGFSCPSETGRVHVNSNTDYAINSYIAWRHWKLNKVKCPSDTFLLVDSWDFFFVEPKHWTYDMICYRHSDGVNLLYCDGHVGWWKKPLPNDYVAPWEYQ